MKELIKGINPLEVLVEADVSKGTKEPKLRVTMYCPPSPIPSNPSHLICNRCK